MVRKNITVVAKIPLNFLITLPKRSKETNTVNGPISNNWISNGEMSICGRTSLKLRFDFTNISRSIFSHHP